MFVLRLGTLSRYFLFFYGLALTQGQGDQDIIILSRTVVVLIKLTLSRATAIFFRLSCALCPEGLPWATVWQINMILSRIAVVLRLITLTRDFLFFYGLALTRGQGDQDIIILSRVVEVLSQVTVSRATAIFFCLGCGLC